MKDQKWKHRTYRLTKIINGVTVEVPHEEWVSIPEGRKIRTIKDDEHGTLCEMQMADGSITRGYIATKSNVASLKEDKNKIIN